MKFDHCYWSVFLLFVYLASSQPPLPPHPRLILTAERVKEIKLAIKTDDTAALYYSYLLEQADWIVKKPVIPEPPSGPSGVLNQVRESLDYIITTSFAYILSTNKTYLNRSIEEAVNLAVTWKDWNAQNHFLDTGEASVAISLFLDWNYDSIDSTLRSTLVNGLVSKGMEPYLNAYEKHSQFWINSTINWNCVCAAGGIISSLAIADEPGVPSWVWSGVYTPSFASIQACVRAYGLEGSWMEGVAYWGYATKYNVFAITALQTALGKQTSSLLSSLPGVSVAGKFPLYMTGGSGLSFNWADSSQKQIFIPFAQWFGTTFNDTAAAWFGKQKSLLSPPNKSTAWGSYAENLLYYFPGGSFDDIKLLPLKFSYLSRALVSIRSAWSGPAGSKEISSFHVKGGDNTWNHAHLDLGSWVFDRHGVRWVFDLGGDNYSIPGYFGPTRWHLYRLNTHGHNSVRFDGEDQSPKASAALVLQGPKKPLKSSFNGFQMTPLDGTVVIDLAPAYISQGITHFRHAIATTSNVTNLIFLEEITAPATIKNLTWSIHTKATITISPDKQSAEFSGLGTEKIMVTILPPSSGTNCRDAIIMVTPIDLLPPQESTKGVFRLDVVSMEPAKCTTLGVQVGNPFVLEKEGESRFRKIDEWEKFGPFF